MANSLGVSVITTKRAYSDLEDQGFVHTVQGKGSFVSSGNKQMLREEQLRRIEGHLGNALEEAASVGIELAELHQILDALALD